MFTKRIIPCLDVNNGRVVKGVNFVNLRDAGDPVEIAAAYGRAIQFDETAASPWFTYTSGDQEHEVWFEDVRSLRAKFDLIRELGLRGAGYWNLMRPFRPNWLLLNGNFRIEP